MVQFAFTPALGNGNGTLTVTRYDDGTAVFAYKSTDTAQVGFYWHLTAFELARLIAETDSAGAAGTPFDDPSRVLPFDPNM